MLPICFYLIGSNSQFAKNLFPSYAAVECPNLHSPLHGAVSTSDSTKYLSVANYSCDYGYKLIGYETRKCGYSGLWSGMAPGCFGKPLLTLAVQHCAVQHCVVL